MEANMKNPNKESKYISYKEKLGDEIYVKLKLDGKLMNGIELSK